MDYKNKVSCKFRPSSFALILPKANTYGNGPDKKRTR
jgi:hypothetical protein